MAMSNNNNGLKDPSTVDSALTFAPPVSYEQKQAFAAVGAICLVLGIAAATVKVLTVRRSGERTTAQNWTFGVSVLTFTGFIMAGIAMFSLGEDLNETAYASSVVAATAFYQTTLVLLRIALLCMYQDMLFNKTRYWRFSFILAGVFITYSIIFVIVDSMQCKPVTRFTDLSRCINTDDLQIVLGIFDFLVNAIVLAMPAQGLWRGRRGPDVTNNICYPIAFGLGFIACVLSLVHGLAPASAPYTWSILYPMTGLLTLTLILISFAVIAIPTFIRCRAGPIMSPTTTHPHLQSRSASVLSWVARGRNGSIEDANHSRAHVNGHQRNQSVDTIPSVTEVPTDIEKSTEALPFGKDERGPIVETFPDPPDSGGRTNSMRSFQRLGSLTGGVKPPSFLRTRSRQGTATIPPAELDLTGITVKTEVQMSYEARRKAMGRSQSRSTSPGTRKVTP